MRPKICIECKWCQYGSKQTPTSIIHAQVCTSPNTERYDLITGEKFTSYCVDERNDQTGLCKIEAKYFEPKEEKVA